MELCWSASSNNTLIYSEEGMGVGVGQGGAGALCTGILRRSEFLSPSWDRIRLDMGKIRPFEPFPPSFRTLLNFFTEVDNPSLSLNQQTSVPLATERQEQGILKSKLSRETGRGSCRAGSFPPFPTPLPPCFITHIPAHSPGSSPNCQQLFGERGGYPSQ